MEESLCRNISIGSHGPSPAPVEPSQYAPETFYVQGYTPFTPESGAVSTPITLSSTFHHPSLGVSTGFDYSRGLNPTRLELERTVAVMEHAPYALAFSSGMAAVSCLLKAFSPGDEIVVSSDLYGGTWRMFSGYERYGLRFVYVDTSDFSAVEKAITPQTRALYIETPSNPLMRVTDIDSCARLLHSRRSDSLVIVDNTFLSPYYQNPLDLGADIVVHSGTKYLAGHHDCIAGILAYKKKELDDCFRVAQMTEGASLSPFDSWLVLRGIKTLALRMERSSQNAAAVADFLKSSPHVEQVFFPGFADAPGHELFARQSRGTGGMVSFYVHRAEQVPVILQSLSLVLFAESLGGVQSLITYPVTQTHQAIPEEMRNAVGVSDRLLRISVGIENSSDLIADIRNALEQSSAAHKPVIKKSQPASGRD
ncbi:MAG: PLP-dependent transferase [Treponema sp.]|nr:PLP-dependent transferase [Treponema sp.]